MATEKSEIPAPAKIDETRFPATPAGNHKPGVPAENTRFANNKIDRCWSGENFVAVEKLAEIAAGAGMPLLQLAMKWRVGQPAVTTVIGGVSRLEQLTQNIAPIGGAPLSAEVLEQCDRIWRSLAGTRFAYNR